MATSRMEESAGRVPTHVTFLNRAGFRVEELVLGRGFYD